MSLHANNCNGMEESLHNTIHGSHRPVLISDANGNKHCSSAQIAPETLHVATKLTIENCMISDMQMFPCNNNVGAILSDQKACGLQDKARLELEVAEDHLCDGVTNSQSSSSDQYMTANLSCNSESSATITDPGWCTQTRKLSNSIKSKLPCVEPLGGNHATDIVQKLNSCVTNEAYLQKAEHVSGNSSNFDTVGNTIDKSIGIKKPMENLEYSILPCETELEMKGVSLGSTEHELSVAVLESSVFSNSSYDPIVSDQSLDVFESAGESELMDDVLTTHQLPIEVTFNSKDTLEGLSNRQQVVDEGEQVHCQTELSQSTGFSLSPCQNPNQNCMERVDRGISSTTDDQYMKYQSKEMVDEQSVAANEQSCDVDSKKPMRMATAERHEVEACRKPADPAMNATFIVLQETNNAKSACETISWNADAQECAPQAGDVTEETFLISNTTIHEDGSSYSQTSTPLPESTTAFFSSPFLNPTGRSVRRSGSTTAGESPTNLQLQPNARDPIQKHCGKVKHNANMKAKLTKVEIKCYPKPNFNYVKPKVVSRIQMNLPPKNVPPSSEGSSKNIPKSICSIASPWTPGSQSSPEALNKDQLSKSASEPKSAVLKLQSLGFKKTLPTNKQPILTGEKISKCSCKSAQTPTASKLTLIDGASSQVHNSLHYSKPSLSSASTAHELNKTFHYDGRERANLAKHDAPVVEKPRARCTSLAGATDRGVGYNVPVSKATLEKTRATEEVALTKSAPSDDKVGQRLYFSNKRSLPMPSQSAKLRVPSSVSKSSPESVKDGHTSVIQCPTNKQLLLSEEQKVASIKAKPRLGLVKATSNLGCKTVKGTFNSKLPVPTSGLKRVNSLSSNSSGLSIQSTCSSKATVASVHHRGDGSRERILSACSNRIQNQSVSVLKNKSASVKSPCKGAWRNVNSVSKILPGSVPRSARQLSTPSKLKADRTWVKSSSTQKTGSRTNLSTQATDLRSIEKRTPGLLHYKTTCEKQVASIAKLKELLKTSNQRCEAIAIVVQCLQVQKEEAGKRHKELSQELLTLHHELETRNSTCAQLAKDREELQKKYEGVIQKLSEEHQNELKDLEERLKQLFNAEKEHLEQNFKKDVEILQEQLQKEVESLTSKHEAHKLELVATHAKNLESLERDYQQSLAELTRSHELDQKTLEENFKERQLLFEEEIAKLNEENDSLKEEIKTKEMAKVQMQKDQKVDPLGLYLEQELESLKAVLEIKNEKIHDQEKKLMQMEKLMEKHIVLDEKLKIVLQENEDLKARMDKHIAVSRQLSTEQVVLQESLQKESKVNKRLSMENEELLWKLQNGDVLSPKKLSPSSSFSFQSSRNSTSSFSGPAPSPR
ncbi:microtubule-associated tumor suppressor 1 homolog [Pristis pectinata]|uniref:microtubule-associated tumor suppressor 1 homolog n=1 Tax=Pristis pectinata TaxID=685728 RepID=UPI00223D6A62|nr:microtubule-associated tumor suppressor 1 homolog [Pristis pectinata]XP_051865300.1 microtubule-associated tumor suppressor 1 homolog [Pristis pectinata]XP_051865306.1 microtubule-associated tumor suppressor 1 homolog [Pristis pectinata]